MVIKIRVREGRHSDQDQVVGADWHDAQDQGVRA